MWLYTTNFYPMKRKLWSALSLLLCAGIAVAQPITGTLDVCTGYATALSHTTPGGSWSSSNPSVATIDGSGLASGVTAGTAVISYTVDETTDVATLTVNASPAAISGSSIVCIDGNILLSNTTYTGTWSSSNTGIATVSYVYDNNISLGRVSGIATGTATITYTGSNGCYVTHEIEVPAVMGTPITCDYDFHVCEGSGLTLANSTSGGTWSSNDNYVGFFPTPSAGTILGGHLDLGPAKEILVSYVGYVDDVKRCALHTFTVNPLVRVTYVTEVCVGSSITFVPDSSGGTWSSSNPSVLYIDSAGVATGIMPVIGGANITYQLTNRPNCEYNYARSSPTIEVHDPPAITGDIAICEGTSGLLTTGISGTWSSSNAAVGTIGTSTGIWTGISAGTTTITFTKSVACYTSAVTTVNSTPDAITGTLSLCPGSTTALSSATPGGTWTSGNTGIATVDIASGVVSGIASGTVTITYTAATGCTTTAIVTVNTAPTASPYYDTVVCTGGTLRLYTGDAGGNTYSWAGPSGYTSTLQNPELTSVTTSVNGIYTVTVTAPSGCAAVYTLTVAISATSPYSVSVTQIAPFTLYGETLHTYGSGLTLRADASVTLPTSGVTYTWTGPVAGSTYTFAPTFTPSTVVTSKNYTVTVAYNGCTASRKDTIIVPPSGCSPYNYFSVNNYRTSRGLSALGSCSDCDTVKPFHTINSYSLDASRIVDGENYYLAYNQPMYLYKSEYINNNFFVATGGRVFVDSFNSVTLNHCHFASCSWVGIIVRNGVDRAPGLRVTNNTLIENAYGGAYEGVSYSGVIIWKTPGSGGYYTPGMPDILESNGAIYNRNAGGITIRDYQPSIAACPGGSRLPFTVKNSIFSRVELAYHDSGTTAAENYPFAWPTATQLKTVVSVDTVPKYLLNTYPAISGITCGGISAMNVGNNAMLTAGTTDTPATYEYSYMHIGVNSEDPYYDSTNLFDSLFIAISLINTNARLYNNSLRNITNIGLLVQGSYNGIHLEGEYDAHSNNRFYNCSDAIRMGGVSSVDPWDVTCRNTIFKAVQGVAGMVPSSLGYNGQYSGGHGIHNISNNYMVNNTITHINSGTAANKGFTYIRGNTILSKTSSSSTDVMPTAIYLFDYNGSSTNGTLVVDSNTITGAALGINPVNILQRLYILRNNITLYPYISPSGNIVAGIYTYITPGLKEIKYNTITGQGYICTSVTGPYLTGMRLRKIGTSSNTSDVSCNLVSDLGYGFNFVDESYVSWRRNEMRRALTGMSIDPGASIGTQGSLCDPSDNTWTGDSCTSCGGCADFPGWDHSPINATFTLSVTPTSSMLYIRNEAGFKPLRNGNYAGGTAYTYGSTLLYAEDGSCDPLPAYTSCISGPAERSAVAHGSDMADMHTTGAMQLFPNPGNGSITVSITDADNEDAHIKVTNTLGAEVYNSIHTFSRGLIHLQLQQLPPGLYLINVIRTGGTVSNGRFIIMK